jgi:hypothetical protein
MTAVTGADGRTDPAIGADDRAERPRPTGHFTGVSDSTNIQHEICETAKISRVHCRTIPNFRCESVGKCPERVERGRK